MFVFLLFNVINALFIAYFLYKALQTGTLYNTAFVKPIKSLSIPRKKKL